VSVALLYRVVSISISVTVLIFNSSCGGSHVDFGPTSPTESSSCDDTGDDVTTDNMTVTISGDVCNAPTATVNQTDEIIIDCSEPRDTSVPDEDYVTATCGSGDNTDVEDYYCSDGIVYRASDDTELFDVTLINCTEESEIRIIEEEELIVG
jgi:hypothetical protein